jgi:hypothetical protein
VPLFHKIFHEDVENFCNGDSVYGIRIAAQQESRPVLAGGS